MKIHALQTGTVRVKQFQLTGAAHNLSRFYQLLFTQRWSEWMPIYCWLIEHPDGLILVDVGETAQIYEEGYLPKGGLYHKAVQTQIEAQEELPQQLAKIGFQPSDIQTVILTHMHGDHIGGLKHFEPATIYVAQTEYELANSKKGPDNGYFSKNWPTWLQPQLITYKDGPEENFSTSQQITNDGKIVVVPTPGHSIGHQSVLVKQDQHTTFIAGDLTYNLDTLRKEIADVILMNSAAKQTVQLAHQYACTTPTVFLSSHDWNAPLILDSNQIFS